MLVNSEWIHLVFSGFGKIDFFCQRREHRTHSQPSQPSKDDCYATGSTVAVARSVSVCYAKESTVTVARVNSCALGLCLLRRRVNSNSCQGQQQQLSLSAPPPRPRPLGFAAAFPNEFAAAAAAADFLLLLIIFFSRPQRGNIICIKRNIQL